MFRCPHCEERSIPRWRGAVCFPRFPARCPRCRGRAKRSPMAGWLLGPLAIVPLGVAKFAPATAVTSSAFFLGSAAFLALVLIPLWVVPLVPVQREDSDHILTRLYRHWLRFRRRGKATADEPGPDYFL